MRAVTTPIRFLGLVATLVTTTVIATPAAGATPGHTSCKPMGALVAEEARAGTVGQENQSLPHGTVDDLVHVVQVGGVFFGETVPAFCEPK